MAQRIQVVCDVHQARDEDADGFTWSVSITPPGGRPVAYDVDLCEDDGKGLQDVLDFLAEVGRQVGSTRTAKAPRKAQAVTFQEVTSDGRPVCPQCGRVAKSQQGLRMHLTRTHGGWSDGAE
jgi:uncharacterized C2H2 Zn-finger protein